MPPVPRRYWMNNFQARSSKQRTHHLWVIFCGQDIASNSCVLCDGQKIEHMPKHWKLAQWNDTQLIEEKLHRYPLVGITIYWYLKLSFLWSVRPGSIMLFIQVILGPQYISNKLAEPGVATRRFFRLFQQEWLATKVGKWSLSRVKPRKFFWVRLRLVRIDWIQEGGVVRNWTSLGH
jgi:hypothetical protein